MLSRPFKPELIVARHHPTAVPNLEKHNLEIHLILKTRRHMSLAMTFEKR